MPSLPSGLLFCSSFEHFEMLHYSIWVQLAINKLPTIDEGFGHRSDSSDSRSQMWAFFQSLSVTGMAEYHPGGISSTASCTFSLTRRF